MMHESQTLAQAIQDAPRWMSEEEAQHRYQFYLNLGIVWHPWMPWYRFNILSFAEWLTVNRVRVV